MSSECAQCHISDKTLQIKLCGDCRLVGYCSKQCQFSHWKSHKPTCDPPQTAPAAAHTDPISKLTERVNAARYQQCRPREFSAFMALQDVIHAAEKTYKDAMRDAETLLSCEPKFADRTGTNEDWIDVRWEWVDVCEKILGKGQAALQTLNMFHKKLEAPPVLVGSNGTFIGEAKKKIQHLHRKYARPPDDLKSSEADFSTPPSSHPCSRCRVRGSVCDGNKGRACAPCKRLKTRCNFSTTKPPESKSNAAPKRPTGTPSATPLPEVSHGSEKPSTLTTTETPDQPSTSLSQPKPISIPVIQNGVIPQQRPSRAHKRKRSIDSSDLQKNIRTSAGPNVTTSENLSAGNIAGTPTSKPNEVPCHRCKALGKSCIGSIGRPCLQCKKGKVGCNFSNPKNAPKASTSASSTVPSPPPELTLVSAAPNSPMAPTSNRHPEPCQCCKEGNTICTGPEGLTCDPCNKVNEQCSIVTGHEPKPRSAPSTMAPAPTIHPTTPLPPLPPTRTPLVAAPRPLTSNLAGNMKPFAFAEFLEPCSYCRELGASCWGLKDFESASGSPKPPSSCRRCLESDRTCDQPLVDNSIKRLESFFAAKSDPPPRTTSSGVLSPGGPGQQPCTMVHPMHSTRTPSLDAEAQDHSVQVAHPLVPENKAPSLHEGMNASRRSLTGQNSIPWGRVSQVGAKVFHRTSSERCQHCESSGRACSGPQGVACVTCKGLRLQCSRADVSRRQEPLAESSRPNHFRLPRTPGRNTVSSSTVDGMKISRIPNSLAAVPAKIDNSGDKLLDQRQLDMRPRAGEVQIDSPQTEGSEGHQSSTVNIVTHCYAGD